MIEWGADRHVPAGSVSAARHVRALTMEAGLAVSSYGSYARAGMTDAGDWEEVAVTAVGLGAPRVRVWAVAAGSGDVSRDERASVVVVREAAVVAQAHGLVGATEFREGTLTDSVGSTLQFLAEVDQAALGTYWQPPEGMTDDDALAEVHELGERVCALHAFSWWPGNTRLVLAARGALWGAVLGWARGRDLDALLEFLPGDDFGLLPTEASTLRDLAGEGAAAP